MGGNKFGRSILKNVDLSLFKYKVIKFFPFEFNGDQVFELLPLVVMKEGGLNCLDGMDYKRDGRVRAEIVISNISNLSGILSYKYVKCIGHLQCINVDYCCISKNKVCKELYWFGSLLDIIFFGPCRTLMTRFKIVCKFYRMTL